MTSRLGDYLIDHSNSQEYHQLKQEIFTQNNYYAELESDRPVIIDAGAHIGLSVMYFKKLNPAAQIIAIEPNPAVLPLLEKNITQNFLEDVQIVPAALIGHQAEAISLHRDRTTDRWWSTAGIHPGAWTGDQKSESFTTKTIRLDEVAEKFAQIDLLKLDIEGLEQEVLKASPTTLAKTKHIFVEFHPGKNQDLSQTIQILDQYFETEIFQKGKAVMLNKARGLVLIEGQRSHPTR